MIVDDNEQALRDTFAYAQYRSVAGGPVAVRCMESHRGKFAMEDAAGICSMGHSRL
jgi:hypothetical protein